MNPTHSNGHPGSSGGAWSNRELIELAQLDALGLLDEQERQAFERAFARAPGAIQQLVRDSQLRATELSSLLPDVQPPATLRQRVLDAVAGAIAGESAQPEVTGRLMPAIARASGVAPFWRAAAIGSVAAALLFGVVTVKLYSDIQRVNDVVHANAVADRFMAEFGRRFETAFYSDKTEFVQFSPASNGAAGMAVMLVDQEGESAQFFAKDLPQVEGGYTLALIGPDGQVVRTIARIEPASSRIVNQFAGLKIAPGQSVALRTAVAEQTVMTSRNL